MASLRYWLETYCDSHGCTVPSREGVGNSVHEDFKPEYGFLTLCVNAMKLAW